MIVGDISRGHALNAAGDQGQVCVAKPPVFPPHGCAAWPMRCGGVLRLVIAIGPFAAPHEGGVQLQGRAIAHLAQGHTLQSAVSRVEPVTRPSCGQASFGACGIAGAPTNT